ncbi:MAG: hypothetical protein WD097_09170 [Balneolales bacterium]
MLGLSALIAREAAAYRSFGIHYPESTIDIITENEIERLLDAGITWLLVEGKLDNTLQQQIRDAGMSILVLTPEYFPVPNRLANNYSAYAEHAESLLGYYRHNTTVKGFGLFAYGNWHHALITDQLYQTAEPYLHNRILFTLDPRPLSGDRLTPFDGTVILTRSAGNLKSQMEENPTLTGVLYAPHKRKPDLRDIQELFSIMEPHRAIPVFFDRNWFFRSSELDLAHITRYYSRVRDARLANPAPKTSGKPFDLSVLLLFILWGAFAGLYYFNPIYRKSFGRFIFNYGFFVNNILIRRIRFSSDIIFIYIFISFIAGMIAVVITEHFFDPVSRQALLHYIPLIPSGWSHPMSFFGLFFIISALINALLVTWLRLANNKISHTHQIATLLLWPQHFNIVTVTLGIIVLRPFPSEFIAIALLLTYWMIILISFFTTAYNMRRLQPTSPIYIISTYGLFILLSTLATYWLVFEMDFLSAWNLAVALSAYLH